VNFLRYLRTDHSNSDMTNLVLYNNYVLFDICTINESIVHGVSDWIASLFPAARGTVDN
jgi:hypothetical protein